MFDLTGKRALVTGASGGIGREIAKALAAAGATVALSGTRVAALEDTAKEMARRQSPDPAVQPVAITMPSTSSCRAPRRHWVGSISSSTMPA